ncbi:MAG: helix-turn-helix domain-containing protein [Pseudomonadota bacterium]
MLYQNFPLSDVTPGQRFEHFSSLVNRLFSPTRCRLPKRPPEPFYGAVDTVKLERLAIANVATSAVSVDRLRSHIGQINEGSCLVKFQLAGQSSFEQCGQVAHLLPGDFVICSNTEPYRLRFDGPYRMSVLAIDEVTANRMLRNREQLLGQRMPAEDPSCALLSSFVANVAGKLSALPETMAERVEHTIIDLLGGVVTARTQSGVPVRQPAAQTLMAVKQFIETNLCDRRLGPAMIASNFAISTRYLHKLFSAEPDTVTRYIRSRRLAACHAMLQDPAARHMTITEIAIHWGFYDLSHLTHAFSERYGRCPSAVRAGGDSPAA